MFDSIKNTFRGRLGRNRPASTLPQIRTEEPDDFEANKAIKDLGKSGKAFQGLQLPTIPHLKPLSIRNLPGETEDKSWQEKNFSNDRASLSPRKAASQDRLTLDTRVNGPCKFDPSAPLTNKSIHAFSRKILRKKYQSKFTIDFTPPQGLTARSYDFMWVDDEELDRKVLEDIVWVRQRYAQAGKMEPTDQDILWWYDAYNYQSQT